MSDPAINKRDIRVLIMHLKQQIGERQTQRMTSKLSIHFRDVLDLDPVCSICRDEQISDLQSAFPWILGICVSITVLKAPDGNQFGEYLLEAAI